MKISTIFAIKKLVLYSVVYDNNTMEFKRLFDNWIKDLEYLENFFEENKNDLQKDSFYGEITVEDAIERTRRNAIHLRKKFYAIANGQHSIHADLQAIFRPLHNNEYQLKPLSKEKSKNDWLRIYAIRISENTYVISGGAIKLTLEMNTRPHLAVELKKLELTKQYLIENGLTDEADFGFFELQP